MPDEGLPVILCVWTGDEERVDIGTHFGGMWTSCIRAMHESDEVRAWCPLPSVPRFE